VCAAARLLLVVIVFIEKEMFIHPPPALVLSPILAWAICGLAGYLATGDLVALYFAIACYLCGAVLSTRLPDYYYSGVFYIVLFVASVSVWLAWGLEFVSSLAIAKVVKYQMFAAAAMSLVLIPLTIATSLPFNSYLYRKKWNRPRNAFALASCHACPLVSIHVPCYAEPPDVVEKTLRSLSELDYPNYEVIVVDNNTVDQDLWRPIEKLCNELGSAFRFFHVDRLDGAKAGALNYALARTNPDALLVGVVDADYVVDRRFLSHLVGYFEDQNIGFVQTPHDYRDYDKNPFMRACYWEYLPAYRLEIPALNEWSASYIIGTMCLIRKSVLREIGGWDEWCLTEDSECALRIHKHGLQSLYIVRTMGRGVIPESFLEYKKQRLRWTAGPIQQLKKHWSDVLPFHSTINNHLTTVQRTLALAHGIRDAATVVAIPMYYVVVLCTIVFINTPLEIEFPLVIWLGIIGSVISRMLMRWLIYRLAGCESITDMVWASIASMSLGYTKLVGATKGLFQGTRLYWHRTSKFSLPSNTLKALHSTAPEMLIGSPQLLLAIVAYVNAAAYSNDLLLVSSLYFLYLALMCFSSVIMSILAEVSKGDRAGLVIRTPEKG